MELPVNYDETHYTVRRKVREEYVRRQGGLCYYCKQPLIGGPPAEVSSLGIDESLFPQNFFRWPVHLHHSHDSGMTIGAVHAYCNAVLWQYHGE